MDVATDSGSLLLEGVRYAYPAAVFFVWASATFISIATLQTLRAAKTSPTRPFHRYVSLSLVLVIAISHLLQVVLAVVLDHNHDAPSPTQDSLVVGGLFCIMILGIQFSGIHSALHPVWYPYITSWLLSIVMEGLLLALTIHQYTSTSQNVATICLISLRLGALVTLICIHLSRSLFSHPHSDEEIQSLLPQSDTTVAEAPAAHESRWERHQREGRAKMQERLEGGGNWFTYLKSYSIFLPYVLPIGQRPILIRIILVFACMFVSNALNILAPQQTGIVIDHLTVGRDSRIWADISLFLIFRVATSDFGVDLLREWLWLPVKTASDGCLNIAVYSHIMDLSADFHDTSSDDDIWRACRSVQRLNDLLEIVLFQALPLTIDFILAFAYLTIMLGPYEGLITVSSSLMFLYLAAQMIARRTASVRLSVDFGRRRYEAQSNGISGWQTVVSFNQATHECNRFADLKTKEAWADGRADLDWSLSASVQSLALLSGLAASAFLTVQRVRLGLATPGQFVTLVVYWAQLGSPLKYFVSVSKKTRESLIHCEHLLSVMEARPTIKSKPGAGPIEKGPGVVEFNDVGFSYDTKRWILRNLTFKVDAGTTVALVGVTGAGKTTILKLLSRLYDVSEGSISIDGQDIRDVELSSLRSRIGIVPQDAILFADTVLNNVRYARLDATEEEVMEACKAACIHEKIQTFTDGYNSFVGERGNKLSGGELQRVAIARVILKNPEIVLLDEATSAVDTDTEQQIQKSLQNLCRGRTTFIVAHRLSTVRAADRIILMSDGNILEQGTHAELILHNGKYADLWMKQGFVGTIDAEAQALGLTIDRCPIPVDSSDGATEVGDSADATGDAKDATEAKDAIDATDATVAAEANISVGGTTSLGTSDTLSADEWGRFAPSETCLPRFRMNPQAAEFTPYTCSTVKATTIGTRPPVLVGQIRSQMSSSVEQARARARTGTVVDLRSWIDSTCSTVPEHGCVDENRVNAMARKVSLKHEPTTTQMNSAMFRYPRYSRRIQSKSEPSSDDSLLADFPPPAGSGLGGLRSISACVPTFRAAAAAPGTVDGMTSFFSTS